MKKSAIIFFTVLTAVILAATGCSYPKNFTRDFYASNEKRLENLRRQYNNLYREKPFALLFETKDFNNIGFEIITDSIKYVYHFDLAKTNFTDTLSKYSYNVPLMKSLIKNMQNIQCTWITKVDYYEDFNGRFLTLMAVRNKALNNTFKGESYCTLAFFETSQPFDKKGHFLDRADRKRNRMINGYKLNRVNDRVGYAITKHYR